MPDRTPAPRAAPAAPRAAPAARRAASVPTAAKPGLQSLITLATGVIVIGALFVAREIMVPITLAVLLSFVLAPLVALLRRVQLGRVVAVLIAVTLALSIIAAIGGVIGTQVAQLAGDVPKYQSTIQHKMETVRRYTLGRMTSLTSRLGQQLQTAADSTAQAAAPAAEPAPAKPIPVEVHLPDPSPFETAERVLSPILSPLSTAAIVFLVAVFILIQQEDLRDRIIRLFGSGDLHRTTAAMDDAARRLSRYFLTQLGLNAVFGVAIGIGLFAIGVPNPVLWAITSALFRFVPYIGSVISGALPTALAAAVDPGWGMALSTAGLFLVLEPLMGQVIEPVAYGHSTGLSPLSVVLSAIFWAWLWGPIGLIMAMPLTLCLVVMGRHVERLEFLDVLLGDRPALTPVESFYQRMLAADPDEAERYAKLLLKERSLSSYYDEVALQGLQLAASDCARGAVSGAQLDQIRDSVDELVEALSEYDDVDPPAGAAKSDAAGARADETARPAPAPPIAAPDVLPAAWQTPAPVLCLAGRGPLDEAVSAILAQLLGKHGLHARVAAHEAASRSSIAETDFSGVAMVCISYLDVAGTPLHLRYLLRRLRQRLPGVPILVGLWPAGDAVLTDESARAAIGADHYTTSLGESVETCLQAAHAASAPTSAAA